MSVKYQVWPSFLAEIAPTLKSAEILAEDSTRQSILENISNCFVKACASKFDPKQAEADYDACLGNPEVMRETCKVVLEQAGIPLAEVKNTGSTNAIWKFVVAKLAAMRVDACTTAIKNILEKDTLCGEDYLGCLGLGLTDIHRMVPSDSLVACAQNGATVTDKDWDEGGKIGTMVNALMLNLDNNALAICEELAMKEFSKICMGEEGEVTTCDLPFNDENLGTKSLSVKLITPRKQAEVNGLVDFTKLMITTGKESEKKEEGKNVIVNEYPHIVLRPDGTGAIPAEYNGMIESVKVLDEEIGLVVKKLTGVTKLSFCTEGRDMSQIYARSSTSRNNKNSRLPDRTKTEARFPRLLDPYIMVLVQAGMSHSQMNYDKKLSKMIDEVKKVLKPSAAGIIDGGICWLPMED